ncbi:hypothetical protein DSM101010T_31780 [Desulfovibrio subterraneus]|uniref:Uncharacterized protein n=1 Tax=Desulfovibrio subterraneus TaxID=2718620 RepID=A0A7J0BM22_9BACT|nr:hypothetical protein DSM101010T_31780 [Desulfovibrio subterraneus]
MRGDGDLWDYCVDDPISCVDPWGLWSAPVQIGLGAATAIAYGGAKGAAYLADKLNGQGDKASREVDRIFGKHVVPINAGMAAAASGAQAVQMGVANLPGAASAVKEGAKMAATTVRNKGLDAANAVLSKPATINGAALSAGDFIAGYALPGPYEPTKAGALGFTASAIEELKNIATENKKGSDPNEK